MIARLVKDGRFSYPRVLEGMEAELRVGATLRSQMTEELGAIKNKMIRWLDRYFPEFVQVFPTFGKMALAALERTPFPSDVTGKESDGLLALYREVEGMKSPQRPKAKQLIEVASSSIGITEGKKMAQREIAALLSRYRQKLRALLFRVMMPMIRHNEAFKKLHEYYTTRTHNPLRKKQSIVVLCGKLLKVLHTVCTKQVHFDAERMMNDSLCLQEAA